MMHVVPKWRVRVWIDEDIEPSVTFGISDNHIENVWRTLAMLDFGRVTRIDVGGESVKPTTVTYNETGRL